MPPTHQHNRRKGRMSALLFGMACAFLSVYFAYHSMYGRFGIEARLVQTAEAETLARELRDLEAQHRELARDVSLLRSPAHPDMVEEAARRVLGFVEPGTRLIRPGN